MTVGGGRGRNRNQMRVFIKLKTSLTGGEVLTLQVKYRFRCQLIFFCVSLRNAETEDGVNTICTCHVTMLGKISHLILNIYV
jgi:hypothetical protein